MQRGKVFLYAILYTYLGLTPTSAIRKLIDFGQVIQNPL